MPCSADGACPNFSANQSSGILAGWSGIMA
jgi:hypothetical protein